jgi:hypothetical protein
VRGRSAPMDPISIAPARAPAPGGARPAVDRGRRAASTTGP